MTDFTKTADARETSIEIMEAIEILAKLQGVNPAEIWEAPTVEEVNSIWETVTRNGLKDGADFCWGAAGTQWFTV